MSETLAGEVAGSQIGRYRLLEQVGEGGMGTIWLAEQREPVKRRVALKIIKLGMDTKEVIARFEVERQALAIMDDPHIAKVFDAGVTETGRPYFVMEYIKGIPILEYCDRERLDTKARLGLFVNVCQAIQHAHQKGVIHRDIKPSNVLVTVNDGSPVPKVIDFGVAKATHSELTAKTLFTEHGRMIGTPAYMSPEQAAFTGLDIDTRSDVYSLGVLLYELLTGTTPFDMEDLLSKGYGEMMRAICEDEPHKPSTRISSLGETGTRTAQQRRADPKRLGSLLQGDIDWIVMKCLEKDRTRRYETANGLAADIRRHLSDEPVTAGAPSAAYRLRKFVKRNRIQVIAGSVALAALLAAIVGTSWGLVQTSRARSADLQRELEDQRRTAADDARLGRNAAAVTGLLDQGEEALRAGDAAKAKMALEAARKRLAEGGAEKDAARLARLTADLTLLTDLNAIDQFLWTWAGRGFGDPQVASTRTREALGRYGAHPEAVPVEDAAARAGTSAIRDRVLLAMDRLLWWQSTDRLRAVLRRVDPHPYRDALRDAIAARDRGKVEELARDPAALEQPPEFAAALGQGQAIPLERRRELLVRAAVRRPSDIGLLMTLQNLEAGGGKDTASGRMRWLQAALAADPRNSAAHTNLGLALRNAGQADEALACFRKAIEIDPTNAVAHNNLGAQLLDQWQMDEAIACYRKAVELDPKDAISLTNLGEALVMRGEGDEGIAWYRKAIEVDPSHAQAHALLGDSLRAKGRVDEAIASYRTSIDLDPRRPAPHLCLGLTLQGAGRMEEAVVCYRKALELDPKYAAAHGTLGDVLRGSGQVDEAIAHYRKAIELDPGYNAYGPLGEALRSKGQFVEAIACYRKAIELDPNDGRGWGALAQALSRTGQLEEAIVSARRGLELDPTSAPGHYALALVFDRAGRQAEAIPSYRRAIEIDPKYADAHHDLGVALMQSGHLDETILSYERAVELEPDRAAFHFDLADVLQTQGRLDEAISSYRAAIEVEPNHAEAHCELARTLERTGRFAEALASYRRGHEVGSRRTDWPYPSVEWVRQAEARAALEANLPALLSGEIQPRDPAERLDLARVCRGKKLDRAATRLYAAVFAADPRLADDLDAGSRYDAAAGAALAAAGRGEDAAQLDDAERARLRRQSLDWLRADLTAHAKRLETGKPEDRAPVQRALREWQRSSDLAGLRDTAALVLLPAEDRNAFLQLWADVATLLAEASSSATEGRDR